LVDYKQRVEELAASDNPFAVVVQAHLAAQATKGKTSQQRRRQRKYSLTTMLYERGWSEQEVIDLYRFIDWVLTLPLELESAFRDDLETYERGKNMPYISAIERMGEARGEAKGKVDLIGLQLANRVGGIPAETTEKIKKLPIELLDQLALDLMSFTSIVDLTNWLQQKN
jgi:hypothetical protein